MGGKIKGSGGFFFPNPTDTFIKPSDLCECNSDKERKDLAHVGKTSSN